MPLAPDREANDNPAYLLGRLWAKLHALEIAATGDPVGVIGYGKWAGTISTPTNALRHQASYAAKWETSLRRRGHVRIADRIHADISALVERIGTPGSQAGLEASEWFVLGYGHQKAADSRDAELVEA